MAISVVYCYPNTRLLFEYTVQLSNPFVNEQFEKFNTRTPARPKPAPIAFNARGSPQFDTCYQQKVDLYLLSLIH